MTDQAKGESHRGHPNLTWYCANCGWKRGEVHTCPPDPQETIGRLLDLLPPRTPSPGDLAKAQAEIERLQAENEALRMAARALTESLEKCDAYGCKSAGTQLLVGGDDAGTYCDSCAEDLQAPCGGPDTCDFSDLDHAPALRALRALLPPGVPPKEGA